MQWAVAGLSKPYESQMGSESPIQDSRTRATLQVITITFLSQNDIVGGSHDYCMSCFHGSLNSSSLALSPIYRFSNKASRHLDVSDE